MLNTRKYHNIFYYLIDYVPNGEEEEPGDDQETEDHTSEVEGDVPLREVTQDADDIDILLNTPDDLAAANIKHGQSRSGMKRKSTVQPKSKKQKRKKTVCSSGSFSFEIFFQSFISGYKGCKLFYRSRSFT